MSPVSLSFRNSLHPSILASTHLLQEFNSIKPEVATTTAHEVQCVHICRKLGELCDRQIPFSRFLAVALIFACYFFISSREERKPYREYREYDRRPLNDSEHRERALGTIALSHNANGAHVRCHLDEHGR